LLPAYCCSRSSPRSLESPRIMICAASNCMQLSFERNHCTSSGRSASYANAAEEGSRDETELRGAVNTKAPDRMWKKSRRRTHHPVPVDDGQRRVRGPPLPPCPRRRPPGSSTRGPVAASLADFHCDVLTPLPPRLALDR
jgi:hypothetical protein